jgi:hypothetical protein
MVVRPIFMALEFLTYQALIMAVVAILAPVLFYAEVVIQNTPVSVGSETQSQPTFRTDTIIDVEQIARICDEDSWRSDS